MSIASTEKHSSYYATLTEELGSAWNRFWFTPASVYPLAGLRILVGILAFYFVASHTLDLTRWFARDGMLPVETVRQLTTPALEDGSLPANFHWSYLNYFQGSTELWIAHFAGMVVVALFALGFQARITSVLATIVVLSYVHRTPLLVGQFEAILTMLLVYLAVGPCAAVWSVDAWRLAKKLDAEGRRPLPPADSILANISLKLIQIHVAGFYILMGLSQLGGAYGAENSATWWRGEALWWLIAKSESRIVDLTFLSSVTAGYLVNAWTHAIVFGELAFGLLVWKPSIRPLMLALAALGWISLAPVTGLVSYSLIMLSANLAFLTVDEWQALGAKFSGAKKSTADGPVSA
ncbi:MAG: hypothetical protein U1A77_18200 [Pirellulales bacterium]